jgi:hypothetical protein
MILTWMLYGALVAALVAAAAAGLEGLFRLGGIPLRFVWTGALLLTLALVALAPGRGTGPAPLLSKVAITEVTVVGGAVAAPEPSLRDALAGMGGEAVRRVRGALGEAGRRVPAGAGSWLLALCAAATMLTLGTIGATHRRFYRARRAWPTAELLGTRVRVAPEVGPVVMGVARPEIVVPRWLLHRSHEESRLVLAHESEHIRARDPLLLTLAWGIAALLAWNPAVWWMVSRLRLAVELDCDARVLRRGESPRSYGSVLIDLAGRSRPMRAGMLALADPPSQLERRLLAMTYQRTRARLAQGCALGSLALVALLAACAAELPTAAEIEAIDVAGAEAAGSKVALLDDGNTVYKLDGVVVTREEALALTSEKIASVGVVRARTAGGQSEVAILTRKVGDPAQAPQGVVAMGYGTVRRSDIVQGRAGPVPVLFIDGVRKPYDARTSPFGDLRPEDIESISILKDGEKAMAIAGPDGVNGVIVIRTKNGPDDGFDLGDAASQPVRVMVRETAPFAARPGGPAPVYFIDGVRATEAEFRALDQQRIESVSVIKEVRAATDIAGPEGVNGVVQVTTKKP